MNIHFDNIKLFENLKDASLASCQFGSYMYKTNDEFSDKDIHYIYATSNNELNSFLKSHHHLQYKENGVDHIFVNLHTFLNNVIKGDSTVLFEIIHSDAFIGTPLEFLNKLKDSFNSYTITRCYLGLARRDIQYYHRKETHREQIKALGHIYRGYYFAKSLIEKDFKLINEDFLEVFNKLKEIEEKDFKSKKAELKKGELLVSKLREELNYRLNNNQLNMPKYMDIDKQILLDSNINYLINSKTWIEKQLKEFDMYSFYHALENDVNY